MKDQSCGNCGHLTNSRGCQEGRNPNDSLNDWCGGWRKRGTVKAKKKKKAMPKEMFEQLLGHCKWVNCHGCRFLIDEDVCTLRATLEEYIEVEGEESPSE